uniref:Uncharacterized protein n=1 Tax=Cacopsylla melanoneura TaxID=428564 RepID=A0A8D8PTL8_9HEMI
MKSYYPHIQSSFHPLQLSQYNTRSQHLHFHPLQQSQHNTRSQHLLQIPSCSFIDFMSKSFAFCAKFQISLKKKAVITVKAESGVFLGTRLHFSISFFFGLLHFMEMTFQICNFI